jgi:hypothetical protein
LGIDEMMNSTKKMCNKKEEILMDVYVKGTENENVVFAVRKLVGNRYGIVQISESVTTHYPYRFNTVEEAIEFTNGLVDAYNDGYLDGIDEE